MDRTAHLALLAFAGLAACVLVVLGAVAALAVAVLTVTIAVGRSVATSLVPARAPAARERVRHATA